MIRIESLGAVAAFRTSDAEQPVEVTFEGEEYTIEFLRDRLRDGGFGMFGHAIDLKEANANDVFTALNNLGLKPRYVEGRGSVPPLPETGAVS